MVHAQWTSGLRFSQLILPDGCMQSKPKREFVRLDSSGAAACYRTADIGSDDLVKGPIQHRIHDRESDLLQVAQIGS
jgi:hypothetical protein